MKRNAILINVGRAPVVNERDSAVALRGTLIAGSARVLQQPIRSDGPLLKMADDDRLYITPPHRLGIEGSPHAPDRTGARKILLRTWKAAWKNRVV